MGKKINPKIFRLNTFGTSNSKWFNNKQNYALVLEHDVRIRKFLQKKFEAGGVSKIEIKRSTGNVEIVVHTAKPGVIIGRGGAGVEEVKKEIKKKFYGNKKIDIKLTISEVSKPDLDAELIFQNMSAQLQKRVPFRRVMKRSIEQVKRAGAKGVKVCIAGRLNGVEIARTEVLTEGKIPTHTLRADIDYARGKVPTIYGALGVKVWIYKGDVFKGEEKKEDVVKPRARRQNQRELTAPVKKMIAKKSTATKKVIKKDNKK